MLPALAVARSGTQSPLKSPMATDTGSVPAAKPVALTKDTVWASAAVGNVNPNTRSRRGKQPWRPPVSDPPDAAPRGRGR